jgi:hypothetical protein
MEDVLDVYTRPYDLLRPQICMDEVSKQLLRDTCQSLPMEPGRSQRHDYEYERDGVVNLFMFCEPLGGALGGCDRAARRDGRQDRLALQDGGCTHQAQATLSFTSGVTEH